MRRGLEERSGLRGAVGVGVSEGTVVEWSGRVEMRKRGGFVLEVNCETEGLMLW